MQESLWGAPPRPTYRRPPMAEVLAVPWNGLTAVSTFSGAGGSSLGLQAAGWRVPVALEALGEAATTYRANFPGAVVVQRDVREVSGDDLLYAAGNVPVGALDLFEGSPPCASFSKNGIREKGYGRAIQYGKGLRQRTDDLFDEWVRLVAETRPRAVLAENVEGMAHGVALEEHLHRMMGALTDLGYRAMGWVLDAQHFGVPQRRKRLIVIGYRADEGPHPTKPVATTPEPFTVGDALATIAPNTPDHEEWIRAASMEPYATGRTWAVMTGRAKFGQCFRCGADLRGHPMRPRADGKVVPWCEAGVEALTAKPYYSMHVAWPDRPAPTLTAKIGDPSAASVVHHAERRKHTPAEAKALSGFPPDFHLVGDFRQRTERIGRAVPPPLYRAIGAEIADVLGRR